ncbi:hypothetical protein HHL11_11735 [Ramlibacter sp. G-1-2-2]|uniref:Uncharacterized protein n=1 Tax=Ramlibacter agri TaxID=2728837 RepID=A0A848H0E6_9BURK|nr:hypothetical protein [Ramlibacter agri]NML44426.1 hypothetical protein [Ramlibacter agri]
MEEHRRRVTGRRADIEGRVLPAWKEVSALWIESTWAAGLVIDTGGESVEAANEMIVGRAS